jgi:hypothetical protein
MEVSIMKYRVRVDLSYEKKEDADSLMALVGNALAPAVSINEGRDNEEISYCDYELCGHDEGKPCTRLERTEIRK